MGIGKGGIFSRGILTLVGVRRYENRSKNSSFEIDGVKYNTLPNCHNSSMSGFNLPAISYVGYQLLLIQPVISTVTWLGLTDNISNK